MVWGAGGVIRRSAAFTGLSDGFAAAASVTVGPAIHHIVEEPGGDYYVATDGGVYLVDVGGGTATHLYSSVGGGAPNPILPGGSSTAQLRHVAYGSREFLVAALQPPNRRTVVLDLSDNTLIRDFPPSSFARRGTLKNIARQYAKVTG